MNRLYPSYRPTVADFFCGAGGLSLGFEQAGFDIVLGVDADGHHVATHERNFPYGYSFCGSVVDLNGERVRKLAHCETIDVVVGGPPCQGFSHMGLRDLHDPRNSLVAHYMRLVLEIRPKVFLMENVPGLLSGATRRILDEVIELAEANGYEITKPVRVLDASDFGVPQKRRRLFLLGTRSDLSDRVLYPEGICPGQPPRPTVLEAISDLPDVDKVERLFGEGFTRYTRQPTSLYGKVARGIIDDPSDLSRPREWERDVCTGCLRVKHSPSSVDLYASTPPGQTVPGHKLPRLDPDGICPTLRAGSDSTHGSYTAPRPIHPLRPRCITAREAARLHGFPDWFSFYPLKWHAYRQIGNAVCPPIAKALGAEVLKVLVKKRTTKPPAPIALESNFVLPDDRPRTLKRIPIMEEFPPVINHLFEKAIDRTNGHLRRASFTFKDVQAAIESTGAKLHWVREDTFLAEVARSRAVKRILASVHEAGYSILPLHAQAAIGKFVPVGTPGTIDDKETVQVRIDEIHRAISLVLPPMHLNGDVAAVEAVLAQPKVKKSVWGNAKAKVSVSHGKAEIVRINNARSSVYDVSVTIGRMPPTRIALLTARTATPTNRERISRIAQHHKCDEVVLFVSATSKHFVAIRYENCQTAPQEASRTAFLLASE